MTGQELMRRIAQIGLGIATIAVLFARLVLRHQAPLNEWATSSTLTGWAIQGAAWLSLLAGIWPISAAWAMPDQTEASD